MNLCNKTGLADASPVHILERKKPREAASERDQRLVRGERATSFTPRQFSLIFLP